MKIKMTILLTLCLTGLNLRAEYINDFDCTLNEGYTVPQLMQFQAEWMQAAREKGFDEHYKTRVLFPVYNKKTDTNPLYFVWRGYFKDGAQWGKMSDWFLVSEWAAKFNQVMNCSRASLWFAPE